MPHTPGPWLIAPGNFIVADCYRGDSSSGKIVAEVPCAKGNPDDLPLIAAAPELLEACRFAIGFCVAFREDVADWHRFPQVGRLFAMMACVIGKAQGTDLFGHPTIEITNCEEEK